MVKKEIMVSICCITYNQDKYIKRALESFLEQKTTFKYEIIVHDDASTDNTRKIIEELTSKYPDIIKPIYEEKNQYSINTHSVMLKNLEKVTGKYIAFCEGDDYWIDENKLQMQYDYMENHSDCTLCVHGTVVSNELNKETSRLMPFNDDDDFTIEDFLNHNYNFHTSSMFFPSYLTKKLPDFYMVAPVGDLPLKLYFLSYGYGHYIDKCMSTYTMFAKGSWSTKKRSETIIEKRKFTDKIIDMYKEFNKYTKGKYQDIVNYRILEYEFNYALETSDIKEVVKIKYKKLYKKLPFIKKVKLLIKRLPFVNKVFHSIKGWCKNGRNK